MPTMIRRTRAFAARPRSLAPVLAMLIVLAGASSASAATKDYSVSIAPPTVAPGVVTDMTATVQNLTKTQQVGSLNLAPPSGYTLQTAVSLPVPTTTNIVDNVLQVRDLALQPGASVTLSLSVLTACATGTITRSWQSAAKQSNNFQGAPGNAMLLDAARSSLTTTTIGACVPCPEDSTGAECTTQFSQPGSTLNMRADPNPTKNDSGVLKMRPLAPGQLDCADWTEYAPGYRYDPPPNRDQVFTMTYPGTRSGDPLNICFGVPASTPFDVKPGTTPTTEVIDGEALFVGLPANCMGLSPGPCIVSRDSNKRTITGRKGPGDPQMR